MSPTLDLIRCCNVCDPQRRFTIILMRVCCRLSAAVSPRQLECMLNVTHLAEVDVEVGPRRNLTTSCLAFTGRSYVKPISDLFLPHLRLINLWKAKARFFEQPTPKRKLLASSQSCQALSIPPNLQLHQTFPFATEPPSTLSNSQLSVDITT